MPKLSEIITNKELLAEKRVSIRDTRLLDRDSLVDFTDLTPLDQAEIDLFWPYPGSELERKIALRLATRTAEEAIKAITAKWSGTNAPCHKCGLPKNGGCNCLISCARCWIRYYRDKTHVCDEARVEEIAKNPWIAIV